MNKVQRIEEQNLSTNRLNGVDLDTLMGTVNAIHAAPALGVSKFRASNTWLGANHNRSTVTGFYAANHHLVSQIAGLVASVGGGFIVVGLVTAALVSSQAGEWARIVASFAALSGFIYLALAIDAQNARKGIIDSVTGILMFVLAYASLNDHTIFLGLSFSVSVIWVFKELWFKPHQTLNINLLAGWVSFNLGAILILALV